MKNVSESGTSQLDQPEVLNVLFHPRPDMSSRSETDIRIPVDQDVEIGARFHMCGTSAPNLLFFHGNGEIVSDYDDMGLLYGRLGINFLAVDYRGYGVSGGRPSVTAMLKDARTIFEFAVQWLEQNKFTAPVTVMGRSLGSASALEIACAYADQLSGLVVESGFAYTVPLLRLLGVPVDRLGITEEQGVSNLEKMKQNQLPTRIIHAEFDHIIPFSDGVALYEACPARDKEMLTIPGADHNTIFYYGREPYLKMVDDFLKQSY